MVMSSIVFTHYKLYKFYQLHPEKIIKTACSSINKFIEFLNGSTLHLSNNPFMLLTGEAGIGEAPDAARYGDEFPGLPAG